jgi:hypothetical protein
VCGVFGSLSTYHSEHLGNDSHKVRREISPTYKKLRERQGETERQRQRDRETERQRDRDRDRD